MVHVTCARCGTEYQYNNKNPDQKYCSYLCRRRAKIDRQKTVRQSSVKNPVLASISKGNNKDREETLELIDTAVKGQWPKVTLPAFRTELLERIADVAMASDLESRLLHKFADSYSKLIGAASNQIKTNLEIEKLKLLIEKLSPTSDKPEITYEIFQDAPAPTFEMGGDGDSEAEIPLQEISSP